MAATKWKWLSLSRRVITCLSLCGLGQVAPLVIVTSSNSVCHQGEVLISTRLQMEWLFFWSRPGDLSFAVPRPLPESRSTSCLCLSPVSPDSSLAGGDDNSVPQKLLILDARSYTAAVANRAKGGGCECEGQGSHTLETVLPYLLPACFYQMPLFFLAIVFCL